MDGNGGDNHNMNRESSDDVPLVGTAIMAMLADYGDMKTSLMRFEEQLSALAATHGVPFM